jgi:ATP-dependent Clp protease adapter protein ClpS
MINIVNRLTRIFNQPQNRLNHGGDFVTITVHNDDNILAIYVHLVLIDCFEHIDNNLAAIIVCTVHNHGSSIVPPRKFKRADAEKSLEKIKILNKKTGNNLLVTIENI